jgi:hypothetical protein
VSEETEATEPESTEAAAEPTAEKAAPDPANYDRSNPDVMFIEIRVNTRLNKSVIESNAPMYSARLAMAADMLAALINPVGQIETERQQMASQLMALHAAAQQAQNPMPGIGGVNPKELILPVGAGKIIKAG